MRRKAYDSHMFLHKSGGQRRRLEQEVELRPGERKRIKKLLAI
ncbi:MAG: 50S ribosomal protein L35 [Fimbriimonadales bacterium]